MYLGESDRPLAALLDRLGVLGSEGALSSGSRPRAFLLDPDDAVEMSERAGLGGAVKVELPLRPLRSFLPSPFSVLTGVPAPRPLLPLPLGALVSTSLTGLSQVNLLSKINSKVRGCVKC